MFKENIFFGQGVKMFRYKCHDPNIYINTMSCTTHPHNTLAQFLGETGLIGTFFLLAIIIYFMKEFFYFFNKKLRTNNFSDKHLVKCCLLLSFCITFMIVLPSGNFFNNWLSTQNFLSLGFYFYVSQHNNS
jgi:O-antigen ligase